MILNMETSTVPGLIWFDSVGIFILFYYTFVVLFIMFQFEQNDASTIY